MWYWYTSYSDTRRCIPAYLLPCFIHILMDLTGSGHYQVNIHLKVCKCYIFKCSLKAFSVIKLEIINIPKKPCWMIFSMIPLPMHPAIASHRDKKGPGSRFAMRSEYSAVTKTSLFVAKITFVVAEMILK